ncbi:unnamed protein product [Rangifer tarandus platyrhynchus]|uniref:Uncharacterized protein n=2 Tax=Rangifer tarandus platyrhynchus TaxID=3082113 RepID=A0ACB0F9L8_RANTA|nr:unnamed protein product [Rangifer tarandus platyrhynchus]CAI9708796.1 unnamed protein product [Rangifer tarandus platyrhynchus]
MGHMRVSFQKILGDLQAEEDKVNPLTKTNSKLSPEIHKNCKREAELLQLWWEPEVAVLQSAAAASRMHRKHTDSVAELIEHVEKLQRVLSKLEKDKQGMKAEINASVETTEKSKARSAAVVSLANTKRAPDLLKEQLEEQQGGKFPAPQDLEKTVHELGDAEEWAGTAETALSKLRSRHHTVDKGITSVGTTQVPETGSSKTPSEE